MRAKIGTITIVIPGWEIAGNIYRRDFPPPVGMFIKQSFPLSMDVMAWACWPLYDGNPQMANIPGNRSSAQFTMLGIEGIDAIKSLLSMFNCANRGFWCFRGHFMCYRKFSWIFRITKPVIINECSDDVHLSYWYSMDSYGFSLGTFEYFFNLPSCN